MTSTTTTIPCELPQLPRRTFLHPGTRGYLKYPPTTASHRSEILSPSLPASLPLPHPPRRGPGAPLPTSSYPYQVPTYCHPPPVAGGGPPSMPPIGVMNTDEAAIELSDRVRRRCCNRYLDLRSNWNPGTVVSRYPCLTYAFIDVGASQPYNNVLCSNEPTLVFPQNNFHANEPLCPQRLFVSIAHKPQPPLHRLHSTTTLDRRDYAHNYNHNDNPNTNPNANTNNNQRTIPFEY